MKTPIKIEDSQGDFRVTDATGEMVFDDGSACGEYSASCTKEDAAFIVKAVNAHEGLIKALKELAYFTGDVTSDEMGIAMENGRKAIALAEAKS